jgi:cellulose synthase/poly-beta-1,6-N-acetylglucosamine synthase-like glycosyltransferase
VDDHSSDNSINVLLDELDISFKIIKLKSTEGKKFAIKNGVETATHQRILTLDADVSFSVDYFNHILTTPCDGLTILPVQMNHSSLIGKLNACEFWFFQRLTFGLAGFKTFALCNGANLLFTKSVFNKALKVRTDAQITSGDDIFLLKALTQLNLPIKAINNTGLSVNTEPPLDFKSLISQRKRWLSKTTAASSILGGLFVLGSNLLLPICIYLSITKNEFFIVPILIKLFAELISLDTIKKVPILILHQITYLFYLVALIISLAIPSKNVWRS